jgi:hypothetical protein
MAKKKNFWKRNEGQLIGLVIALIVAYFAAQVSARLTAKQINEERVRAYQGHLYTLHTELYWHNHHLNLLRNSLNLLAETATDKEDFLVKKPVFLIDTQLTDQILLNLIVYKEYDHTLVVLCTSYSNQIKSLNYFLDFENASELMKNMTDEDKSIEPYISQLDKEYITKTQSTIFEIQIILQQELSHLPNEETLFELFFKENTHNRR